MFGGIDSIRNKVDGEEDNRPTDKDDINELRVRLQDIETRLPREPVYDDVPMPLLAHHASIGEVIDAINKLIQQKLTRHKV